MAFLALGALYYSIDHWTQQSTWVDRYRRSIEMNNNRMRTTTGETPNVRATQVVVEASGVEGQQEASQADESAGLLRRRQVEVMEI